jgi:hypothetical protein
MVDDRNDSDIEPKAFGPANLCRVHQAGRRMGLLHLAYPVVVVSPYFVENRGVQADLEGHPILAKDPAGHEHRSIAIVITVSGHHSGQIPDSSVEFVVCGPLFFLHWQVDHA